MYEFIIRLEAEQDLAEAFLWYEEKRQGLGYDFLLHVHAGFRFLERDPLVFSGQYKEVRCYLIHRFPYKIFYRVEAQKVIILGVIYGGRNPAWVKKRIKGR